MKRKTRLWDNRDRSFGVLLNEWFSEQFAALNPDKLERGFYHLPPRYGSLILYVNDVPQLGDGSWETEFDLFLAESVGASISVLWNSDGRFWKAKGFVLHEHEQSRSLTETEVRARGLPFGFPALAAVWRHGDWQESEDFVPEDDRELLRRIGNRGFEP